jgi:tRNA A22 N-methylase
VAVVAGDGGDDLAAEAEAAVAVVAGDGGDDLAAAVAVAAAHPEKKVERPVLRSQYSTTMLRRREISFSYPLRCH